MRDEPFVPDGDGERSSGDLLADARSGDETALESLVARHYSMLRAFIRLRVDAATRARESVSDLTQSVCREVLRKADQFTYMGEPAFRAWLCEAALRKLRDRHEYHRAQKRDVGREARQPRSDASRRDLEAFYRSSLDPQGRLIQEELVERLEAAVDRLSDDMRQVLTLRSVAGLSYEEIGEMLGRRPATVRQLVYRARARLTSWIGAGDS